MEIEYDPVKDEKLDEFSKALTARQALKPLYRVTATLTGTFLAGQTSNNSMGIRQISAFEATPFEDVARERW